MIQPKKTAGLGEEATTAPAFEDSFTSGVNKTVQTFQIELHEITREDRDTSREAQQQQEHLHCSGQCHVFS